MTVRTVEVKPAPAVVVIDLARTLLAGVGPVLEPTLPHAREDGIEVVFINQKRVVLKRDVSFDLIKVERRTVVEFDDQKGSEAGGHGQTEDLR